MHYTMLNYAEFKRAHADYEGEAPLIALGMGDAAGVGFFSVSGKL